MELDSRKGRRNRMMRSKSFDSQVRDRPEGSRRVKRISHLVNGNNRCLPDGRNVKTRKG